MKTKRKDVKLLLIATIFVCLATMILFGQVFGKTMACAAEAFEELSLDEVEYSTELETNDPNVGLVYEPMDLTGSMPISTYATGNSNSTSGKRIANHEKITNMTMFPENEGDNGCGLVAMGILLKFYNELDNGYQNEFIPNFNWDYNSNYSYATNPFPSDYTAHQNRANALRDEIDNRTPKTFGGLFGSDKMTVPSNHYTGFTNYFNLHSPQIQKDIYYSQGLLASFDITSFLDNDMPVALTLMNYHFVDDANNVTSTEKEKFHVVIAYGYRIINGQTQYLVHAGWWSGWDDWTARWVKPTDGYFDQFIYGYCRIVVNNRYNIMPVSGGISIDGMTYDHNGELVIPNTINGTSITDIGNSAFVNQTQISQVSIPSSVTKIGWEAFSSSTVLTSYGGSRADIDLVVVAGTKDAYLNNGWTGFNIVELSASGALAVTSGQLRGVVEVPMTFNNRDVASIKSSGFANQTQITGISILSATTIGSNAFANCTNLEGVVYISQTGLASTPNHSTSYNNYYYTERSLDIFLMAGVTFTLSFDYSNLTSSTSISNVFTSLGVGENTFAVDLPVQKVFSSTSGTQIIVFTPTESQIATNNKLWCRFIRTSTPQSVSVDISNVNIEVGVKEININSFNGCEKLATPDLDYRLLPNNTYAVAGIKNDGILDGLFFYLSRTLFVPSFYDGKAVTQIDADAFADEDTVKWAFIQSGISTIGNRAFQFCYDLETVNLSATAITRIEAYTFDTCALGNFRFPSSLTYIGEGAFIRTGNVGAMPDSVTTIGNYAFAYRPNASTAYLPDNLSSIGSYAFAYCDSFELTNVSNTNLTNIGTYAFYNTILPSNETIPVSVTTIGNSAFRNSGFSENFALSSGSQLVSIGTDAFNNCGISRIVLPTTITTIGAGAFSGNANLTIYAERSSRPTGWSSTWNSLNRPVIWGCTLSSNKQYVLSFTKSSSNPSNPNATNGITQPYRSSYSFGGWYTASDYSGTQYMDVTTAPNGTLYAKWNKNSCVAEDTLITLADGSQLAVEDLTGNESLLVWNMATGTFDSAPILFIDSDPYAEYEIIHLYFSDGTEVKVIYEHGFWDIDLNEYVFLRNDAEQYVGDWFNKQTDDGNENMSWTAVQLVDIDIYMEYTTAWSPVTFGYLCYYVNGMLSMPGATEGLINIFEVDAVTMQYNMALFTADISIYGLFTYEEFAEIITIPEVIFEAFNGQYLKVSIGKGLIDMEGIIALIERYADFFTEEDTNMNGNQNSHQNSNGNGHHNNGNQNGNGNHNNHGNGSQNRHRGKGRQDR